MAFPHRVVRWRLIGLLLASTWLGACVVGPSRHYGPPRGADLRLDTESAAHLRHAAAASSANASAYAAALRAAFTFARNAPALLTLLKAAEANELELQLLFCAQHAEQQVNASFFGNRPPTREECRMEVEVDECGQTVTMAMFLGRKKHELALECAKQVLDELWPAPYSIEQRFRIYQDPRLTEGISPEKEKFLIETGQTHKLRGTIKPDIVLHASRWDGELLRSLLTLDYKFPCPDSNQALWTVYSNPDACDAKTQQEAYERGLGGPALLISPRGVFD